MFLVSVCNLLCHLRYLTCDRPHRALYDKPGSRKAAIYHSHWVEAKMNTWTKHPTKATFTSCKYKCIPSGTAFYGCEHFLLHHKSDLHPNFILSHMKCLAYIEIESLRPEPSFLFTSLTLLKPSVSTCSNELHR